MQQYLSRKPFDLYSLHLFLLVAKHRNFTKAAREAGLSQSALTRQMQSLESRLGLDLIVRTTRSVEITEAGQYLATEAGRLVGGVSATLEGLITTFTMVRPVIRVGVSKTVSLSHLPGIFRFHQQKHPDATCKVTYESSGSILSALDAHEIDVALLCPPPKLPESIEVTHRFKDRFALIGSASLTGITTVAKKADRLLAWLADQPWLLISEGTNTGKSMRKWLKRKSISATPAMELDNFDLIISLVASGMGVAMVPERALALYRRKRSIIAIPTKERFSREMVVATRRHRRLPNHVMEFVEDILF